jgi:hypothetical protein
VTVYLSDFPLILIECFVTEVTSLASIFGSLISGFFDSSAMVRLHNQVAGMRILRYCAHWATRFLSERSTRFQSIAFAYVLGSSSERWLRV